MQPAFNVRRGLRVTVSLLWFGVMGSGCGSEDPTLGDDVAFDTADSDDGPGLHLDISTLVRHVGGSPGEACPPFVGDPTPPDSSDNAADNVTCEASDPIRARFLNMQTFQFWYNFSDDPNRNITLDQIFTSDDRQVTLLGANWSFKQKDKDPITLRAFWQLAEPKVRDGIDIRGTQLDLKFDLRAKIPLDKGGHWTVKPEFQRRAGGTNEFQVTLTYHVF
jgi:hypothetical protein